MGAEASVIVRARDRAHTIGATLQALRSQTVEVEIIVVDSGSVDGTIAIAHRYADQVLHLAPEDFTYGGALNSGAAAASGAVHLALSAHCVPAFDDWVERTVAHYDDPTVAGTNHAERGPGGALLRGPYLHRAGDPHVDRFWGFSNHGSSWRGEVWRDFPFREDMPACEDLEWSSRVLTAGWSIVYDPRLLVPSPHRRSEGVRTRWRRNHREGAALAGIGAIPRTGVGDVVREWVEMGPQEQARLPAWVRRLSPRRTVDIIASAAGARSVRVGSDVAGAPGQRTGG